MAGTRPPAFGGARWFLPTPKRFEVAPSIGGFEVVDFDGRPVAEAASEDDARAAAAALDGAAHEGRATFISELSKLSREGQPSYHIPISGNQHK